MDSGQVQNTLPTSFFYFLAQLGEVLLLLSNPAPVTGGETEAQRRAASCKVTPLASCSPPSVRSVEAPA